MHLQYTPEFHAYFDARLEVCPRTSCWLWTLSLTNTGYGKACCAYKVYGAHRLAYTLAIGPIPPGQCVRHMCEGLYAPGNNSYRRCCNPAHLRVGTHADNMRDMVASGRVARGERSGKRLVAWVREHNGHYTRPECTPRGQTHPRAQLSDQQVRAMRRKHSTGTVSVSALAQEYGVSYTTVYCIVYRWTWRHLEDEDGEQLQGAHAGR